MPPPLFVLAILAPFFLNILYSPGEQCTVTTRRNSCLHAWAMNLPFSRKQAFSELPQLLLERSEIDDDLDNNSPLTGAPSTPHSVREAAAASVTRWQWKFWKKAPPSSPKQQRHKQRKHPSTGVLLTPLPASVSPGRHNTGSLEKLANFIHDVAEREAARSPPPRPHSGESLGLTSIAWPLPPIEAQKLQRPRLVFNSNGCPTVALEQLVRLQECIEPNLPINVLQLAVIPKKCTGGDEIALMPCHSLQHRGYEMLSAELWREPVRDRDKRWLQDEMPTLLHALHLEATRWSMTKPPGANNRGKWARNESCRFHVQPRLSSPTPDSPTSCAKRPQRVLLRAQGTLLSRSYCVVSIFGEGIYGRLYGAGLTGKDTKRCLRVEAYEPATSRTYLLKVTLQDIEWVFCVGGDNPEREALLAPGKKQELLRQLIALLYFEYPEENREETGRSRKCELPVLRISPQLQLNESALRKLEREERLRQEEARRLEDLAALLAKPRRARHRVVCQPIKLRGRPFYLSVYHFPSQARNLVITAYNPSSSTTYRLTVGLLEAAPLVKLYPYPRSGFSPEQTLAVARGLIPQLRLYGREDSRSNARMMLAINGGRKGPGMNALPSLSPVMTEERKQDELFNKMLRDSQRSLQLELEMAQLRLHIDAEAERVDLRRRIAESEAKRAEVNDKDQTLKIRIEEIDASGGANVDQKRLHEERRAHKIARQALKGEMKATTKQLTELNQQLQAVSEKEKTSSERAQRRADRARKRIRDEVMQSVAATLKPAGSLNPRHPTGQRTWLAKTHMQPGRTLLSSGSCRVSGKRLRHSLFAIEPEIDGDLDVDCRLFSLELYDPGPCSRCTSFVFSKLEWLAVTKPCHEQQQLVPELAPATADAAKRLVELREQIATTRHELFKMKEKPPGTSKGKAPKTKTPPSKKKREELQRTVTCASNEIHRLGRDAPWPPLIKALCARCAIVPGSGDTTAFDISLDRCIFRAVSPVLRISNEETEDENDGDSGVVYCHVRAEVLPLAKAVVFDVWEPLDGTQWRVEYPESRELLREFAVETFIEQQMHLEAIMMSLLLHPNPETGCLDLRFEE